ncbi:monocarboxylate transporter 12-B-like [Amphiura filiformis]|uniref:monocarboxylate transporter 12-B-like n=1 Tax=Amphiura filiformis TaxID=82378 RepID=UPI003B21D498
MTGSFIASVSFLFTAMFVDNYVHLLVAFTFAGIGQGLSGVPCILPVTWYFKERFALANGISVVGGSVGMMVLPVLTQHFIHAYGLCGAILLLSGLSFHGCIAGALMRRPEQSQGTVTKYSKLEESSDQPTSNSNKDNPDAVTKCGFLVSFLKQILSHFHSGIFVDVPKFTLFQAIFALYSIGYTTWIVYLVPHAINKNILPNKAVFLSTVGGFGTVIGRVGYGPLVDYNIISGTRLFATLSFLCAITFLVDPFTDSFAVMCFLAFVAGVSIGARYPISITMTKNLVDEDQFVSAMGWTHFFTGLGKTIGGPLTGWLADSTGNYRIAFLLVGGIDLVNTAILFAIEITQGCS